MGEVTALKRRRPTSTSAFGVGRREGHDASGFYGRFTPPALSDDERVAARRDVDRVYVGDARHMNEIEDASVALVVTSPPYFAGKEYEQALGHGHIPATYAEYLTMLEEVFAECVRTLEPGGRIAVNVANLGRKPYRSLSGDVTSILQDRLRLLLRGEIVWVKGRGATGSCAWGSFQRPGNPVIRDLTERVVIASKGRFDRAVTPRRRAARGLPSEGSLFRDEFMEATTDVWEMPAESAGRVGHPAPFPVALPERLIHLFTYRGDLVLDPFIGSGSTAVAAVLTGRHFAGYDTEQDYARAASERVAQARAQLATGGKDAPEARIGADGRRGGSSGVDVADALAEGRSAREVAERALRHCGFSDLRSGVAAARGVAVDFAASDAAGRRWLFDVCGGFTSSRAGLRRSDVLWKAIGKAAVLREGHPGDAFVLFTPALPTPGSPAEAALRAIVGPGRPVRDVIVLSSPADLERLGQLATSGRST